MKDPLGKSDKPILYTVWPVDSHQCSLQHLSFHWQATRQSADLPDKGEDTLMTVLEYAWDAFQMEVCAYQETIDTPSNW